MSVIAKRPVGGRVRESESHFRTEHLHADIKGRSVRGGAATMCGQAASFVLKLGTTAVLARLLTPADFGLVAMVTAVTGFVGMFKDAGLSMATVQRAEINHGQVSTLFWINLILSCGLMLSVALIAPAIAWFYGEPSLLAITLALATLFPLSGLTIQHQALLRRQMRFGVKTLIDVASQAVGGAVGIIVACLGARYWALVAMLYAAGVADTVMVWALCSWRPGLPSRGSGIRPILAFGGNVTAFSFVNYWSRNADNLLIGWYWGAASLGLYSRAYSLMVLPLANLRGPLLAVALPALSKLQDSPDRYRSYYLQMTSLLAFASMPLVAFLFVTAEDVILLCFGAGWEGTVAIFQVLAIAGFVQPTAGLRGLVLLSLGRSKEYLQLGVVVALFTLTGFAIGIFWGPIGIAYSYVAATYLALYPTLCFSFRDTSIRLRDFARAVALPALASIVALLLATIARQFFCFGNHFLALAVTFAIFAPAYCCILVAVPSGRETLRQVWACTFNRGRCSQHATDSRHSVEALPVGTFQLASRDDGNLHFRTLDNGRSSLATARRNPRDDHNR